MTKRILIMGLPGAGKTTLAEELTTQLTTAGKTVAHFNADKVRELYNDWDFSEEGRIRQSTRMRWFADNLPNPVDFVICDFVAPLPVMRDNYAADYTIWVDTIERGRFEDTNNVFVAPFEYDISVTTQDAEHWATQILKELL